MNILISVAISALMIGASLWYAPTTYQGSDDMLGATSFPTSLDSLTNPNPTDSTATVSHSSQHSNANDAIEALEAKVGADSSAVTTSHDYKLSTVTGSDKACSVAGIQTLTNKTLTAPLMTWATSTVFASASSTFTGSTTITSAGFPFSINLGSDATGDIFYRNSSGNIARLGIGSGGQFLQSSGAIPTWVTSQANAPTVTTNATATASTTAFLATTGTSQYSVMAYGSGLGDGTGGNVTYTMTWNGQVKDTHVVDNDGVGNNTSFVLRWDETPIAATSTITVATDKGSIVDATIVIERY